MKSKKIKGDGPTAERMRQASKPGALVLKVKDWKTIREALTFYGNADEAKFAKDSGQMARQALGCTFSDY